MEGSDEICLSYTLGRNCTVIYPWESNSCSLWGTRSSLGIGTENDQVFYCNAHGSAC